MTGAATVTLVAKRPCQAFEDHASRRRRIIGKLRWPERQQSRQVEPPIVSLRASLDESVEALAASTATPAKFDDIRCRITRAPVSEAPSFVADRSAGISRRSIPATPLTGSIKKSIPASSSPSKLC